MSEDIKKVQEEIFSKIAKEGEVTIFKYADLVLHCGSCGNDVVLDTNKQSGVQLPFIRTENGKNGVVALACNNCQNYIMLHFVDAANPPEEEVEPIEESYAPDELESTEGDVKEEVKEEESKEEDTADKKK